MTARRAGAKTFSRAQPRFGQVEIALAGPKMPNLEA
jgi:hypothetical protein